jgi:hypothetical protein
MDWGTVLKKKRSHINTLDVRDVFRVGNNESIIIIARLKDIDLTPKGYIARFEYHLVKKDITIAIMAEITHSHLDILRQSDNFSDDRLVNGRFAIVLQIDDVKKETKLGGIDADGNVIEDDYFQVSGRCIDLVQVDWEAIYLFDDILENIRD